MDRFNAAVEPLWVFLHRGHVIRRICLGVSVWLTVKSFSWAAAYASTFAEPSAQHVAMVAAVTGVPSALLAVMVKFYNTGRAAKPVDGGDNGTS